MAHSTSLAIIIIIIIIIVSQVKIRYLFAV